MDASLDREGVEIVRIKNTKTKQVANIVRIYVHCHKQRLVAQGYGFAIKAEGALRSGSETFTANDRNLIAQKKLYIGNGDLGKIRGIIFL